MKYDAGKNADTGIIETNNTSTSRENHILATNGNPYTKSKKGTFYVVNHCLWTLHCSRLLTVHCTLNTVATGFLSEFYRPLTDVSAMVVAKDFYDYFAEDFIIIIKRHFKKAGVGIFLGAFIIEDASQMTID